MIHSCGVVTRCQNRSSTRGFSVRGFPSSGLFVSTRCPPQHFTTVPGSFRQSEYNPTLGQGFLISTELDLDHSAPILGAIDLAYGFLCNSDTETILAIERRFEILFVDYSLYPFIFPPTQHHGYARTESPFEKQMKATFLLLDTWYPTELFHNESEIGLGIFKLDTINPSDLRANGVLLCVHEACHIIPQTCVSFRRHGRHFATLESLSATQANVHISYNNDL